MPRHLEPGPVSYESQARAGVRESAAGRAAQGSPPGRLPSAGQSAGRGGPPWTSLGTPAEKAASFWPSARRLLA
ncbi:MAG TPA: hypothetical protein VF745_08665, partial [Steroidobacteraceae bacterium]